MNEKNSVKKEKSKKDKRSQASFVGTVFQVYKNERQLPVFYLREESRGKRASLWTFYPQGGGGISFILPRGQLSRPMLQLQYKSGRKSIYLWSETRSRKGSRTLQTKTTNNKVARKGLPTKNGLLLKVK